MHSERHGTVGALSALAVAFVVTLGCAADKDTLQLSVTSGTAPLTVRITGPKNVTDLGRGTWQKWTGCGFNVTWSDDGPEPPNPRRECARMLEHVYSKPGVYRVKVETLAVNPDDSQRVDWTGTATITAR
jgi:PKD repeat protein